MKLRKLIIGALVLSSLTSVSALALSLDASPNERLQMNGTGWAEEPYYGTHSNRFGESCKIKTTHTAKVGRTYSSANGTSGEARIDTTGSNAHLYQAQAFVQINGYTTSGYVGRGSSYVKITRAGNHPVLESHNGYYSG